jgi:O-antigen ligase
MYIQNKKKYFVISTIFYLFWLSIILSINTKPDEISLFGTTITNSINSLRLVTPLIVSAIFIIFAFFLYSKRDTKFNEKYFSFLYLWLGYFLTQLIAESIHFNILSIENIYLVILGLGTLSLFFSVSYFKIKIEDFIKILLVIIAIVPLFLVFIFLIQNTILTNFSLHNLIDSNIAVFNQSTQRITGLSRVIAVANLFFILGFLFKSKKEYQKYIYFLLITILSVIIISSQARGTLLCYFLSLLYLIFFLIKQKLVKKIKLVFFFIALPIIFYLFAQITFIKIIKPTINSNDQEETKTVLEELANKRFFLEHSSGRIVIWSNILAKYNYQNIFGYGPQADRKLLSVGTEVWQQYGNNASNGFFYAFACGGYLGLIFYIIINIKIFNIVRNLYYIKKFKNNFYFKLSITYLVFFLIRQFFENSFSLFSIDFLIVISSLAILANYLKDDFKKNYNFKFLKY